MMNFSLTKMVRNWAGVRALRSLRVSDLPAHFHFFYDFQNERVDPIVCSTAFLGIYCGWQSGNFENRLNKIADFKLKIREFTFSELMKMWKSLPQS